MSNTDPLPLRVYSEPDGRVYLLYEPENLRVEVDKPINEESLEVARLALEIHRDQKQQNALLAAEGENDASATLQQRGNRQIKAIVEPAPGGSRRFLSRLGDSVFEFFALVMTGVFAAYIGYKLVQLSEAKLPEVLHLIVLVVCLVGLTLSIYAVAAPEKFIKSEHYRFWFGKNGLFFLSFLNLGGAASVFASLTLWLHTHQYVILQPCPDLESPRTVDAGTLLDFYTWHLLKLVPLLKLNETIKWHEPLCYPQGRMGVLVLLFQALVVLPCINAIRYSWKNRRLAEAKPYNYIYEPGWRPESNLEP